MVYPNRMAFRTVAFCHNSLFVWILVWHFAPMGNDLVMNSSALQYTALHFKQLFFGSKIDFFAFKNYFVRKKII